MPSTAVQSPATGFEKAPRARRQGWLFRLRRARAGPDVDVRIGSARHIDQRRDWATAPVVVRHSSAGGVRYEINAPGANARNLEVVWEPTKQRIVIGVWAPKPPEHYRGRPDLIFYKSFRLVGYDGAQATVLLHKGVITLSVPLAVRTMRGSVAGSSP